jgi:Domain of unknown function (DUF4139)/N-terminal domain of unknown function (DUF4140)
MNASFLMAAALSCAQFGGMGERATDATAQPLENVPAPRVAASKIAAVTVYQGQALVTREVIVPEGNGAVELVVSPLPARTVESSVYTEGTETLRVLSTRYRNRAVEHDTRKEVRVLEERIKSLDLENVALQKEVAVAGLDLQFLEKLEGFTGAKLTSLTAIGRFDSEPVITLGKFIMENRGTKAKSETALKQKIQANAEAAAFAKQQLAELSSGSTRVERDAVIVLQRARAAGGAVRLSYLVSASGWKPQYRLRAGVDKEPVRLEYLAAVVQRSGEDWPAVPITLSTARPSLDAAPPELLPLKMAVAGVEETGPIEAHDSRSQQVAAELAKSIPMQFANETPLEDVIKYIRGATSGANFPNGIPIYVDPIGLQEAEKTMTSPVTIDLERVPLRTTLKLVLEQLGMTYNVKDGLLTITCHFEEPEHEPFDGGFAGMGGMGGMGGAMGGGEVSLDLARAALGAGLNREAAGEQAEELKINDGATGADNAAAEKDVPSVTFAVAGRLDVPSRKDPQLLEVGRVELPAEFYAKAVPVLTPRVYRLAKLTNASELVLLPGEANVYAGADFVGRMRLPLVAAGEPFVAGFGVDPQLQVSRRLVRKARTVQGGNQVFEYEFRIGLRNYRAHPVRVQVCDRLPRPQGEAVVVNLVKTSAELSTDPGYLRTGRTENLLLWDLTVPPGTIGDKTMYLTYEFRLEYARDLPQPRFISGGLREGPVGGGAMSGSMGGGMGGMGFM